LDISKTTAGFETQTANMFAELQAIVRVTISLKNDTVLTTYMYAAGVLVNPVRVHG
jgi:hypothetical protein